MLFIGTNSLPTVSVAATCTASTSIDPTNTTLARSTDKFCLVTPAN